MISVDKTGARQYIYQTQLIPLHDSHANQPDSSLVSGTWLLGEYEGGNAINSCFLIDI